MAYITRAEALAAARSSYATKASAESEIRKSAGAAMTTSYDIFLSHSYEDAQLIMGVKTLIERERLSV